MTTSQMTADFLARGGQVTQCAPKIGRGIKTQARLPHPSSRAYRDMIAGINPPA